MSELLVDPGHHVERTEQFIKGLLEANEDVMIRAISIKLKKLV